MSIPAIVILVVTLLAFVALAIAFVLKNTVTMPKGYHQVLVGGKPEIYVLFNLEDKFAPDAFEKLPWVADTVGVVRNAVSATIRAWESFTDLKVKEHPVLARVVIIIESQSGMDALAKAWGFRTLSGFVRMQTALFGKPLPEIYISEQIAMSPELGNLVIHEMLHVLSDDYAGGSDDHANPYIWGSTTDTVQGTAESILSKPFN